MKIKGQQTKEHDGGRVVCTSREPIKEHHKLNDFAESWHGAEPEPKNIFLTIRLTPDQMNYLNNICEELKMSKSALIKGLIFSLIPE